MSPQNTKSSLSRSLAPSSRAAPWCRAAAVLALAAGLPVAAQTTYYVAPCGDDAWAGTAGDCQGPSGPKRTIQAAIYAAVDGDTVVVADGTYTGPGNRDIDFGGRAITVRSAGGAEACIIDCQGSPEDPHRAFYFGSGETNSSVLEGFTVQNGSIPDFGGAVRCTASSPLIRGCTFDRNTSERGGAISAETSESLGLIDCTFTGNTAGFNGGAIIFFYSNVNLAHCEFSENSALAGGGAIFGWEEGIHVYSDCTFFRNSTADPDNNGGGAIHSNGTNTWTGCRFIENTTARLGGGLWVVSGKATVTNCTFVGNSAFGGGGLAVSKNSEATVTNCLFRANHNTGDHRPAAALWVGDGLGGPTTAKVINCTFAQNEATAGGAALVVTQTSHADIANCVFWGDTPAAIALLEEATVNVFYSDIQGGWAGMGNIDADPLFANPDPDVGNFRLSPGSRCIDAAANAAVPPDTADLDGDGDTAEPTPLDLAGLARFVDDPATGDTGVGPAPIVDMGAHEFQACYADFNGDGVLDLFDFLGYVNAFNAGQPAADCDHSGGLDLFDFLCYTNAFNSGC